MGDRILDDTIKVWDVANIQIGRIWAANTAYAMANTVTGIAAGATYDLALTITAAHGYAVGSHLRITPDGTTNYSGQYTVLSAPLVTTMEVYGVYGAAESPNLTIQPAVAPGVPFRILETRLHCSGTCATENFTITLNSGFHASFLDAVLFSQPMAAVTNVVEDWSDTLRLFTADDSVEFGFANGNGINWGLEVIYQFLSA